MVSYSFKNPGRGGEGVRSTEQNRKVLSTQPEWSKVSQSSFIFLVPPIRRRPLKKDKTL
jgi:hypothetical protein